MSHWIAGLKAGDADAARRLWERFRTRLLKLARRKLPAGARPAVQEDDIALSVFESLCRAAEAGRFQQLEDRDDLWWYLITATRRKVADHVRRETAEKRGGGRVLSATDVRRGSNDERCLKFEELVSDDPTPEFIVMLDEEHLRLLNLLRDDQLRRVAVWRIEGYTVEEIAEKLGIAPRSVKRKLALIRSTWRNEVEA